MRIIKNKFPNSEYAKKIFRSLNIKFWFGSKKVIYSHIFDEAWAKFGNNFKDGILELYGLKFINDNALSVEITDIVFNDKILEKPDSIFNEDQKVAIDILSLLSVLSFQNQTLDQIEIVKVKKTTNRFTFYSN